MSSNHLPRKFVQAVGDLVIKSNVLENQVNLVLALLSGGGEPDRRRLAAFIHMSFPQKADLLNALFADHQERFPEPDLTESWRIAKRYLAEAQNHRNRIVHSEIWRDEGAIKIRSVSARGKLKLTDDLITQEDVEGYADLIVRALLSLALLRKEIAEIRQLHPH